MKQFYGKSQRGFTLIELLITISLVSFISLSVVFVLPQFLKKATFNYTLNELYQNFAYARSLAIAEDQKIKITCDEHSLYFSADNQIIKKYTLPKSVSLAIPNTYLGFNYNGNNSYPGRLIVSSNLCKKEITFGVGNGLFQISK